jgi:hypothetical protein
VGVFATVRIYSHDLMTPRGVHVRYEANDMADLWDFTPIVQMVQWAQTCSIVVTWFDRDLRQIDPPDLRPPSPENIARAEQAEAELAEVREELRELREQLSKPKRPYRRRMKGESEVGSDEHDGHLSQDNDEGAGC